MNSCQLSKDLQFYLDRSQDALVALLKSVLNDPRLSPEDQFSALKQIASHHEQIAGFVSTKLAEGERKGLQIASTYVSRN